MDRNSLRKTKLAERDNLNPEQQDMKSKCVFELLKAYPVIQEANHIFIYVHFRSEVQTTNFIRQMIDAGKIVSVPVTQPDKFKLLAVQLTNPESQLEAGYYGIPEPTPSRIAEATLDPATIDTVIIPGSVFDISGGRLGYGGGFYDRFLTEDAFQAARVGVAFELQLVDQVPMELHDQYMDILVTEQQIYDCKRIRYEKDGSVSG